MLTLTDEELVNLTHRQRSAAQAAALRAMGIEHKRRPDGSVAVLRAHVEQQMGLAVNAARAGVEVEPNWGALNAS